MKINILKEINGREALLILNDLVREDPLLKRRIESLALKYLEQVELREVIDEVYSTLECLEVEELWNSSGSTQYGYIQPGERAYEMVEEALEPYLKEMKRFQRLSMFEEAKIQCLGILGGIYSYHMESDNEFKGWAPDVLEEQFLTILEKWREKQNNRSDIREVEDYVRKNFPNIG